MLRLCRDKGFTRPEINAYALRKLKPQLEASHITIGYSNSRTCEIGLATHGGIPYMSIAYLVDACTHQNKCQNGTKMKTHFITVLSILFLACGCRTHSGTCFAVIADTHINNSNPNSAAEFMT
jgi:hypothetical protein